MNLLELLFGKSAKLQDTLDKDIDLQEALDKDIESAKALAREMAVPAVECIPQPDRISTRIDESRFGGWPAWPKGSGLPVGANKNPMIFLAQINFADAPPLAGYPDTGLLQFFVSDDDLFGCEFPSKNQEGFRTVFHTSSDGLELSDPYKGAQLEFSPFQDEDLHANGLVIEFEERIAQPSGEDYRIAKLTDFWWKKYERRGHSIAAKVVERLHSVDTFFEDLAGQNSAGMYFGGHPRFTQQDIRSNDKLTEYTCVIMQFGMPYKMMWGDAGEACFLITEADLRARRFENVIFNWDCS